MTNGAPTKLTFDLSGKYNKEAGHTEHWLIKRENGIADAISATKNIDLENTRFPLNITIKIPADKGANTSYLKGFLSVFSDAAFQQIPNAKFADAIEGVTIKGIDAETPNKTRLAQTIEEPASNLGAALFHLEHQWNIAQEPQPLRIRDIPMILKGLGGFGLRR